MGSNIDNPSRRRHSTRRGRSVAVAPVTQRAGLIKRRSPVRRPSLPRARSQCPPLATRTVRFRWGLAKTLDKFESNNGLGGVCGLNFP